MKLTILYRGPLESCNYACPYCPFAKHTETAEEHAEDERALLRFLDWCERRTDLQLSVFFTPWGEALIRRRYQLALVRLTQMPHVQQVAIQTNLSARLDWTERCDKAKLGLWATYHPGEVRREIFLEKCAELVRRGVRFSVGVVGMQEHLEEIETMRSLLPESVYLWVNAYKRVEDYYSAADLALLEQVDPLFPLNNVRHPSLGRACHCGSSVISVDGDGRFRRCHFIKQWLGSIYEDGWESALTDSPCTNATCGCHIGYVHMPELKLYDVFGEGLLARIPRTVPK